ncbi:MAG: hypothetical protein FRX49_03909 [Trebouxia sp. A1-2]|nr:MAG: hypothetical protein FRX49_03909 [Trebouxia sp. A1-2]
MTRSRGLRSAGATLPYAPTKDIDDSESVLRLFEDLTISNVADGRIVSLSELDRQLQDWYEQEGISMKKFKDLLRTHAICLGETHHSLKPLSMLLVDVGQAGFMRLTLLPQGVVHPIGDVILESLICTFTDSCRLNAQACTSEMKATCKAAFSSSSILTWPVKGPLSLRSPAAQLANAPDNGKSREEEREQGEREFDGPRQKVQPGKERAEWRLLEG